MQYEGLVWVIDIYFAIIEYEKQNYRERAKDSEAEIQFTLEQ
ncbi:unnamed protein product [Paramecium octaurelia]|uniref:Uncharacterized protein n=1 Tax=Paramecium octaurelia TaxID=43137 RepID=A0A8S1V440_PAROT|nr:unnamed protein product [Paramecium octaurelia]